jgi:hypothetical protein
MTTSNLAERGVESRYAVLMEKLHQSLKRPLNLKQYHLLTEAGK